METTIYGLREKDSDHYRYVGATTHPSARLKAHLSGHLAAEALGEWLAGAEDVAMDELEKVGAVSSAGTRHPMVAEAEDRWITDLLCDGHDLKNARVPGKRFVPPPQNGRAYRVDGAALRRARLDAWLSQEELAASAGMAVGTVCRIERGRTPHSHQATVKRLATALGVRPQELVVFGGAA